MNALKEGATTVKIEPVICHVSETVQHRR